MRLIRFVLLLGAAAFAWRMLRGRGHEALQRTLGKARPASGRRVTASSDEHRTTHVSAASAANDGFRDDRDVTVGENLSAVGMRPGGV